MKYIDDIKNNLEKVSQEEVETLYSSLFPGDDRIGVYIEGEPGGRSLQALKIGTRQLSLEGLIVYSTGDCFAPGTNVSKVFENFYKKLNCDRSSYICISGSGNSRGPYYNSRKLFEKMPDKPISLNLITSSSESKIGNLFGKKNGNIIKLKGRMSKRGTGKEYVKEGGLLEDEFELGAAQYTQIVSDGIVNKMEPDKFYGYYLSRLRDLEKTKEIIKGLTKMDAYNNLMECLGNPVKSVISCGQGVSNEVAKMNNNRLGHIRPLTVQSIGLDSSKSLAIGANQNYVLGESSIPTIDKNTSLLCISQSGTGIVCDQIEEAKRVKAEYFIITREGKFPEENTLRLSDTQNFYPCSCFLLSKILMDLGIKLVEEGVEINEDTLRKLHVNDKLT